MISQPSADRTSTSFNTISLTQNCWNSGFLMNRQAGFSQSKNHPKVFFEAREMTRSKEQENQNLLDCLAASLPELISNLLGKYLFGRLRTQDFVQWCHEAKA